MEAKIEPKLAWRAVVAIEDGEYEPMVVEDFWDGRALDPDLMNGIKAVLNLSGVVEGEPLTYDGQLEERDKEALRALAKAAGLDEEGNLPEESPAIVAEAEMKEKISG